MHHSGLIIQRDIDTPDAFIGIDLFLENVGLRLGLGHTGRHDGDNGDALADFDFFDFGVRYGGELIGVAPLGCHEAGGQFMHFLQCHRVHQWYIH